MTKDTQYIVQEDLNSYDVSCFSILSSIANRDSSYRSHLNELTKIFFNGIRLDEAEDVIIYPSFSKNQIPFDLLVHHVQLDNKILLPSVRHIYTLQSLNENIVKKKVNDNLLMVAYSPSAQIVSNYKPESYTRNDFSFLKYVKEEAQSIYDIFGGVIVTEENASESLVKNKISDFGIIHFAAHGLLDHQNSRYSKILLNEHGNDSTDDGILHQYEIVNMDIDAQLVTLSACNSGIGEFEAGYGTRSIAHAFNLAGCANTVQSLWPVNDASTSGLMKYFYANLKNGESKPRALTRAKQQFLTTAPDKWKHPYYWAGFVYYGDDEPLQFGHANQWILYAIAGLIILAFILFMKRGTNERKSK